MKCLYKLLMLLPVIASQKQLTAQILDGVWVGNYAKMLLSLNPRSLTVEIFTKNDSIITGTTHLSYTNNRYEHHSISGKFNVKDSTVRFHENLIRTNLAAVYEVTYKMKLTSIDDHWILTGKWKASNGITGYLPFNKVWLKKDTTPLLPDTLQNKRASQKKDPVPEKLNRLPDVQKIIELPASEKDSIKIAVYDNGEIDGDSVSVYVDDLQVISNKQLTDAPIIFYISLDTAKQFQKIRMIAENLGTIPPNTALMIITTVKQRYEVRLNSDLGKNAVVEFFLLK